MADFFRKFVDDLGDENTAIAEDGKASSEFSGYLDTGSYILNAAISGSLFRGMADNKSLLLAGDPATGKTFFARGIVKAFMENPEARVFYYDTESAVTNQMLQDGGIDLKRIVKSEPETLEDFRNKAFKLLEAYAQLEEKKRFPLMIVLDSLSQLPSNKEVNDITEGKDTRDMTKPGVIKGIFRVLRLKAAKLRVAITVTNHVYEQVGAYVPTKTIAGGKGAQYAADTIVMLSKKAERGDDKGVIGNIIHLHVVKSRLSKEGTKVDTRIMFDGGLDRYYGLLAEAEASGLVTRSGTRWEFPDGTKVFEKEVNRNPSKYFTKEFLEQLDRYIQKKYQYTADVSQLDEVDDEVVADE